MKLFIIFPILFSFTLKAEVLNFKQAIDKILERSSELPAVESERDAAKMELWAGRLNFAPTISLGRNWSEYQKSDYTSDSSFLKSSINLFKGGSDWAHLNATSFGFREKELYFREKVLEIEKKATVALLDFILAQKRHDVLKKNIELKKEALRIARLRYKKGLTPRQEVDKATVDLGNGDARLASGKISLENARSSLISLLGSDQVKIDWPWKVQLKSLKREEILKKQFQVEENPVYKRAFYSMKKNQKNLRSSWLAFSPRLDFSFTYSQDKIAGTRSNERLGVLSLSFPLFNGLRDTSSAYWKRAQYEIGRHQVTEYQRQFESSWKAISKNLTMAMVTAKARLSNLALSRRLYRTNLSRFEKGRVSVNDLQFDQNRFLESENLANEGYYQFHLALIDFYQIKGKSVKNIMQ